MEVQIVKDVRQQLTDRRRRLERAMNSSPTENFGYLLREVDAALERIEQGTYGFCETCHDPLEPDRLSVDPLIRYCLDHLDAAEQRALQRDLDLAFQIQQRLLPKNDIRVAPWRAAYHYEPAGPVSGDYCDIIVPENPGDPVYFFVGDVAGKGVAASILMGHLHAMFRSLVTGDLPLSELVARANRIFCEGTTSSHFATLVAGKASSQGEVEIVNAGHPYPYLVGGTGVRTISSNALPIGMFCNGEYPVSRINLAAGDSLVLYTDGLTETRDESDVLYGEAKLTALLAGQTRASHREILGTCLHDLRTFRGKASRADDLTIMVLQRE